MKALFIVLVVVAVSLAGELWAFNPANDVVNSTTQHWVKLNAGECTHIDSIAVYAENEDDLWAAEVDIVFGISVPAVPATYSRTVGPAGALGYRMVLVVDEPVNPEYNRHFYVSMQDIRATEFACGRTYFHTGNQAYYDANVVFYGDINASALERSSWAEIKASF